MTADDAQRSAPAISRLDTESNQGQQFGLVRLGQDGIVFILAGILFVLFAITLQGFLTVENLLSLVRNVSILGVLGIGMAVVVIGRGIDLSITATMSMCAAWVLVLAGQGASLGIALLSGVALAVVFGLISGVLIAYVEIPPLFATLAMSSAIYGFGRLKLVESDSNYLTQGAEPLRLLGGGEFLAIPSPIVILVMLSVIVYLVLRFTKFGRFVYSVGDNLAAARIAGIPVRPLTVALYVVTAMVAFIAGLVTAGVVGEVHTRLVGSTLVYDVILVVALGGISLSGGKGSVRNVIAGTLLIGIMLNGMTILNVSFTQQNIVKGLILLAAIVADSLVNPRDEQTSRQGDI